MPSVQIFSTVSFCVKQHNYFGDSTTFLLSSTSKQKKDNGVV